MYTFVCACMYFSYVYMYVCVFVCFYNDKRHACFLPLSFLFLRGTFTVRLDGNRLTVAQMDELATALTTNASLKILRCANVQALQAEV